MRFIAALIFFLFFFTCASAYEVQYDKADSLKVMELLDGARRQPQGTNIVIYFARRLKGLPYVAHTLEVNRTEKLVVNLRQLDCTTYVENVTALAMCVSQKAYTSRLFAATFARYVTGAGLPLTTQSACITLPTG